jgi:hypothetical protein
MQGKMQVGLGGVGRKTGAWPGALAQDNHDRELRDPGKAQRLGHQAEPSA